jgi:hypothetical protein
MNVFVLDHSRCGNRRFSSDSSIVVVVVSTKCLAVVGLPG